MSSRASDPSPPAHDDARRGCVPLQVMSACAFVLRRYHLPPAYRLGAHAHGRSGFALCLEGEYRALVSGREYRLRPHDLMVLGRDVEHEERADVTTHCVIVEPGPEQEALPGTLGRRLDGFGHVPGRVDYAELYRLWLELMVDDDLSPLEAADAAAEIARRCLDDDRGCRSSAIWLDKAEKTLHHRYADSNIVLRTAMELNISAEHLVRTFRARFGITPGQFVRRRRMLVAARALVESDAPISEIAVDAGFTDQSHLTRMFRSMLRTTPRRYRRHFRSSSRAAAGPGER